MDAHVQIHPSVLSAPLATHERTDDAPTEESPAHHHHHERQQHQQPHQQDGNEPREPSNVPAAHDREDSIASSSIMPSESPPLDEPRCRRTSTLGVAASPTRRPKDTVHKAHRQAGEGQDAPAAADDSSTSTADSSRSSSGSSASSSDSDYDDDSDEAAAGILEDFTEGVDSWLEDVHGAGREAFFGLFKRDATPQFCRPSLEVIGRHVSATSILGEMFAIYLSLSAPLRVGASRVLATISELKGFGGAARTLEPSVLRIENTPHAPFRHQDTLLLGRMLA